MELVEEHQEDHTGHVGLSNFGASEGQTTAPTLTLVGDLVAPEGGNGRPT